MEVIEDTIMDPGTGFPLLSMIPASPQPPKSFPYGVEGFIPI
jgi:hypothetical protein